ncbi:MAG: glycosyltransferase [bacterium]|nr:glycosyltransferase [bacterium]
MNSLILDFSYSIHIVTVTVMTILFFTIVNEYLKSKIKNTDKTASRYKPVRSVAILIASKNGEKTISKAVTAAMATGRSVFVVSDGSDDNTAGAARKAGAWVLELKENVGKPSALYAAYNHFNLSKRYDAVAILDDDVVIAEDFITKTKQTMDDDCAISVGKNITDWPESKKWNMWLASRAYSYWNYQITLRYIQSAYNVMNCISGSNSLYRTQVLDQVLSADTPYIVDDTYWTLETHRLKLGTIKYSRSAKAWLQDPTNFRDWYKQNLRWMWGTFQGIIGHKIGTKADKFHFAYVLMMLDWFIYILSGPITLYVIWSAGLENLHISLLLLSLGYSAWLIAASIALRKPRLILFVPAIIVTDFIFRFIMVHAFIKALRQPTVERCVWNSPTRFEVAK